MSNNKTRKMGGSIVSSLRKYLKGYKDHQFSNTDLKKTVKLYKQNKKGIVRPDQKVNTF